MRFVVYGAGAVGGVLGGMLAEAGRDVVLVARGAHRDAIRSGGLRLETPDRTVTLPVALASGPGEVDWRPGDAALLAMKSADTPAALDALARAAGPDLPVVCVQNGVTNEHDALRRFGAVYGACVLMLSSHLEPGVVRVDCAPVTGILDVGRYPSGVDGTARELATAFTAAGFTSETRPDIMRWKYRKLLLSLSNAVETVSPPGAARDTLLALANSEGDAALAAAGIAVAGAEEFRRLRDQLTVVPVGDGERGGPSMWQSLRRGTGSVEADHFNGEIVLLGRLHGVPTPANELIRRTANRLAATGGAPHSVPAEELLGRLAG